jgi:hypothetical protein
MFLTQLGLAAAGTAPIFCHFGRLAGAVVVDGALSKVAERSGGGRTSVE